VSQQWVIELYLSLGQGRKLIVCQDLSLPSERIDEVDGELFSKMELSSRTIVVIRLP
jgi:precorrin-6B methylase 1